MGTDPVGYADYIKTSDSLQEQYVYDQLRLDVRWTTTISNDERDDAFLYLLKYPKGNPMSTPTSSFPKPDLP